MTHPTTDQHPDVAPPCWSPSEVVTPGHPEFYCQRGKDHPGLHEAMLRGGSLLQWGPPELWPSEDNEL
jgi:hypothetical protein